MAGNSFDFPAESILVGKDSKATLGWLQVFQRWHTVVISLQQSGTTANRPVNVLWIGRQYYDTTLGYPVWVHSVNPTVWHNAAGAVV